MPSIKDQSTVKARAGIECVPLPIGWIEAETEVNLSSGGHPIAVNQHHEPMRYIHNEWEVIELIQCQINH
jgi:ribosome-associated toxin RatA of RatAB toxin-antitoxin module